MIEREMVANVAKLARLSLDEAALDDMSTQLGKISVYIDRLAEVDVSGVELVMADVENAWRKDEVRPSQRPETLIDNAPKAEAGYVVVPKVVDDSVEG